MWWKLAVGAVAGLIVGHFVTPGYALWVVVGIVAGYLVETYNQRQKRQEVSTGQ